MRHAGIQWSAQQRVTENAQGISKKFALRQPPMSFASESLEQPPKARESKGGLGKAGW